MTLTALVGALVALVPAVPKPQPKPKHELEIERLQRTVETLEYELESVSRELAAERQLSTHWIGEASRISRTAREDREQFEALLQRERHMRAYQPQQALAQAQQAQALAMQNIDYQQQGQQLGQQAQAFGFCNCVPSRTQMFNNMTHGAVIRLNEEI